MAESKTKKLFIPQVIDKEVTLKVDLDLFKSLQACKYYKEYPNTLLCLYCHTDIPIKESCLGKGKVGQLVTMFCHLQWASHESKEYHKEAFNYVNPDTHFTHFSKSADMFEIFLENYIHSDNEAIDQQTKYMVSLAQQTARLGDMIQMLMVFLDKKNNDAGL